MTDVFRPSRLSSVTYDKNGDKIEVTLRDSSFNPYFKGKAGVKNKKELKQLIMDLKAKGVDLTPWWS